MPILFDEPEDVDESIPLDNTEEYPEEGDDYYICGDIDC